MTVVYFTESINGYMERTFDSATIKTSGFVFCFNDDGTREVYPPHQIERIWDDGEGGRGERLTSESPHGRV